MYFLGFAHVTFLPRRQETGSPAVREAACVYVN